MKLLFYTHYFPPSVGGVETITSSLASGIAEWGTRSGAPQIHLTLVTQTSAGSFEDNGLPFKIVRQPGLWTLIRMIRTSDVIHIAGPSLIPMLLAWLMKKPTVVEHHGHQAICPNGLLIHQPDGAVCPGHFQAHNYGECLNCLTEETPSPRAQLSLAIMMLRHWLARRMSVNIAVTEYVKQRHGLPRCEVIYHGIEASQHPRPLVSPGPGDTKPFFAFVGRFVREKGISTLLGAVNRLKAQGYNFEVKLIGDGTCRAEIETEIETHGLRPFVTITGFLGEALMSAALEQALALVMPSTWEETAGLAAIEQMMQGRLVIASAIGGLQEIVGDTGMTFPAGDAVALADRMQSVLQNPEAAKQLGEKARERALAFFPRQRMIQDHLNVYCRYLSR